MRDGPLKGIRVLDMASVVSGPMAGALFSDHGADVVKIERPGGDIQRHVGSSRNGFSGSFHVLNRGKRSVSLDLKKPDAVKIVEQLAKKSDVLIENYRPGVMEKLGLGYQSLASLNKSLVYVSISGFGHIGPEAKLKAYDPIIQAKSGITLIQGEKRGEGPEQVNQLIFDKLTANAAYHSALAALLACSRNGTGQHVQVSMLEAAISFLWPDSGSDFILQGDGIDHRPPIRAAGLLLKASDGWISLMALSDQEFAGFCRGLNLEAMRTDPELNTLASRIRNREKFQDLIDTVILPLAQTLTVSQIKEAMDENQVPCYKIMDLKDLPNDDQIKALNIFREVDHPIAGKLREARPPANFSATPPLPPGPAPLPGQHTEEVLLEVGYSDADITKFQKEGVFGS